MGTWNTKSFGNDSVCDWLYDLEKARDARFLEEPLRAVLESKTLTDIDDCEPAVGAADIIAASRQEPLPKLPKEAGKWIIQHGFVATDAQVHLAIKALDRIVADSELSELWKESKHFPAWAKEIRKLTARLQQCLKRKSPRRQPKPPQERMTLMKLIKSISPTDMGGRREELGKRLAKIGNPQAALPGSVNLTPLDLLAIQGLLPEAQMIFERISAKDRKVWQKSINSALIYACRHDHRDVAEWFLQQGANPQVALGHAIRFCHLDLVKLLVQHGADLHEKDDLNFKMSHLHDAVAWHEKDRDPTVMIAYLAKQGLDLNAVDELGDTPLHAAILGRRVDAVAQLLTLGANPNILNFPDPEFDKMTGETPLDLALRIENGAIVKLLKRYKAKRGADTSM